MKYIYKIKRKVLKGQSFARTLGYPTANLRYYDRDKILSNGVYLVKIIIGGNNFHGISFIGKPTYKPSMKKKLEIHIFKFNKNLYNKKISVYFLKNIRGVIDFKNTATCKTQIKKDILKANNYLND